MTHITSSSKAGFTGAIFLVIGLIAVVLAAVSMNTRSFINVTNTAANTNLTSRSIDTIRSLVASQALDLGDITRRGQYFGKRIGPVAGAQIGATACHEVPSSDDAYPLKDAWGTEFCVLNFVPQGVVLPTDADKYELGNQDDTGSHVATIIASAGANKIFDFLSTLNDYKSLELTDSTLEQLSFEKDDLLLVLTYDMLATLNFSQTLEGADGFDDPECTSSVSDESGLPQVLTYTNEQWECRSIVGGSTYFFCPAYYKPDFQLRSDETLFPEDEILEILPDPSPQRSFCEKVAELAYSSAHLLSGRHFAWRHWHPWKHYFGASATDPNGGPRHIQSGPGFGFGIEGFPGTTVDAEYMSFYYTPHSRIDLWAIRDHSDKGRAFLLAPSPDKDTMFKVTDNGRDYYFKLIGCDDASKWRNGRPTEFYWNDMSNFDGGLYMFESEKGGNKDVGRNDMRYVLSHYVVPYDFSSDGSTAPHLSMFSEKSCNKWIMVERIEIN